MTMTTKKNMTTMTRTAIRLLMVLAFVFSSGSVYADDWLELVQKYTSADKIEFEPSKWDSLVNQYSGSDDVNVNTLAQWWNTFGDSTLTKLIEMSFIQNKDIQSSRASVEEARAQLGVTMSSLSPRADGSATYTNTEPSHNILSGGSTNTYHVGIDSSWELDLWGRKRDRVNASKASYEAAYASLENAWVSLSAEVARNYITLRILQEQMKVAEHNIEIQQDITDLLQSQYEAGLKDELAYQQSKYTLERTKSALPSLRQAAEETMNALAVLTGEVPGSLTEMLANNASFPEVDVQRLNGIPAEAIRQRPDITLAEKNLLAQESIKKAAEKDYYPTITLAGSIGLDSLSTGDLFEGNSYGTTFGPRISWPIFRGSEIRKNIRVQSAREEQLLAAYEKAVLNAVAEVRNALNSNVQEEIKNRNLKDAVYSARQALEVARDKYTHGLTDFNTVLNALQSVYSLENELTASDGQKMLNLIMLFKSLGGGWQPMTQQK